MLEIAFAFTQFDPADLPLAKPILMRLYVPGCGLDELDDGKYQEIQKALQNDVKVVDVDCERYGEFCYQQGVSECPALLYGDGVVYEVQVEEEEGRRESYNMLSAYRGRMSAGDVIRWIWRLRGAFPVSLREIGDKTIENETPMTRAEELLRISQALEKEQLPTAFVIRGQTGDVEMVSAELEEFRGSILLLYVVDESEASGLGSYTLEAHREGTVVTFAGNSTEELRDFARRHANAWAPWITVQFYDEMAQADAPFLIYGASEKEAFSQQFRAFCTGRTDVNCGALRLQENRNFYARGLGEPRESLYVIFERKRYGVYIPGARRADLETMLAETAEKLLRDVRDGRIQPLGTKPNSIQIRSHAIPVVCALLCVAAAAAVCGLRRRCGK